QQEYEGFEPFHTGYYTNAHRSYGDSPDSDSNVHQCDGDDGNYNPNAYQSFSEDANYQANVYNSFGNDTGSYGYPSFGQDFDGSAQPPFSPYGHSYGYPQHYEPYASP